MRRPGANGIRVGCLGLIRYSIEDDFIYAQVPVIIIGQIFVIDKGYLDLVNRYLGCMRIGVF